MSLVTTSAASIHQVAAAVAFAGSWHGPEVDGRVIDVDGRVINELVVQTECAL